MAQQSAVSLRRVNEVQELIDAENFSKALQACEKWFKKGERSTAFITKRAVVLALQKDPTSRQRGKDETLKLCDREPALTTITELLDLERSIKALDLGHHCAQKAWDRAAKADPKNSELQETRIHNCIDRRDFKGAQQAAMTLKINFPTVRRYDIWAIFLCYMIAADPEPDPPGGPDKVFGPLAYKMIKTLADRTPNDIPEDELQSAKCILYSEELILLISIYTRLGRQEEILEVLESENLGRQSRIGMQDPVYFLETYRRLLRDSGQWNKIVDLCLEKFRTLLAIEDRGLSSTMENMDVMNRNASQLAEAVHRLEDNVVDEKVQSFAEEALEKAPKNIAFRYLQMHLTAIDVRRGAQSPETILELCKSFFEDFSSLYSLRNAGEEIIDSLGRGLVRELANFAWEVVNRVQEHHPDSFDFKMVKNALELEYCFSVSQSPEHEIHSSLVCKCLRVYEEAYRKPDVDDSLRSSATIPAVMSLLRMSELPVSDDTSSQEYRPSLFQALLILYHAVEKLPQAEEPCVLLISYALMLGLTPLALYAFQKLSIKNLQVDNFAFNMFTRISTLHPHDVSGHPREKEFHPSDYLRSAIAQYNADDRTFSRQIMSGMYNGAYSNVHEAISEREAKAHSLCKWVYIVEQHRIDRLLGVSSGQALDVAGLIIDTRSSEGFPNLELPGHAPFAEHLRFAPHVQQSWVQLMICQDRALSILYAMERSAAQNRGFAIFQLKVQINTLNFLLNHSENYRDQFTEVETSVQHVLVAYAKATGFLLSSNFVDRSELNLTTSEFMNLIDIVEKWLESKGQDLSDPRRLGPLATISVINGRELPATWLYFHWCYATLEALQGLFLFLNVAKSFRKPKLQGGLFVEKGRWEYMHGMACEIEKEIRDHAKHLRGELDKPGFLDDMWDMMLERGETGTSLLGQQLEKLVDVSTMEKLLGMMRDSWASGLEGIAKVKVVLP
ncbi:MAG: hypothetical protein Q9160_009329 [Pyrenula sp. 1 TL-2023]